MENHSTDEYINRSPGMDSEFGVEAKAANQVAIESADTIALLYQLLNEYAPTWYEKHHRQQAEATLRKLGRL